MSYTYDLSTAIGQIRLLIPDNVQADAALSDEEIEFFLDSAGDNVNMAAIMACQQLARKYSQQVTFSADGLSIHATERAQAYADRAKQLESALAGSYHTITAVRGDGYSGAADKNEYSR